MLRALIFEGAEKIMVDILFLAVHQGTFVSDVLADLKWLRSKDRHNKYYNQDQNCFRPCVKHAPTQDRLPRKNLKQ